MLKILTSIAAVSALLFSSASVAALLTLTASEQKIADINVAKSAELTNGTDKAPLTSVGAGLRNKKVVFVNVQVYVGQLFVADTASFSKASPVDSIKGQSAAAMQMTFLRDVDANKIHASFEDSFKANDIDTKDSAISQLLSAVKAGGDIKNGQSITLASFKKDKVERILLETPNGKITEISGEGLIGKVFSLWFGKAADGGVEEMKKSILK